MDISYLRPTYLPREHKHYVIIGYPETKNRASRIEKSINAAPYAYRSNPVPDSAYLSHGRETRSHVLLPLDLRRGFAPDGKIVHFPKPQGMSGSPIAVLYDDELSDDSRVFPIVAVGTRYSPRKRVLFGTDVGHVLEAIARAA